MENQENSKITMADLQNDDSLVTIPESSDEKPLRSLEVPLFVEGTDGDGFLRTQNASTIDYERRNVIERTKGAVHVRCDLIDVIHGSFDERSGTNDATLVILKFRFDPQKESRRVIRARVNIEFFATTKGGATPEVYAIAPDDRWTVLPTTDHEETAKSGGLNLGAAGIPFVDASVHATIERTVSRDISDATTVTGSINLAPGKNFGISSCAAWNLLENKRRKTGVPDSVQVAVLLKREDNELFNSMVTIDADVDLVTRTERLINRKVPLDDPILFNPQLEPDWRPKKYEKARRYGRENLKTADLYSLCEARMAVDAPFAVSGRT